MEKVINLKKVPCDLHRKAKSKAALEGKTLRQFILEAIKDRLSNSVVETAEKQ